MSNPINRLLALLGIVATIIVLQIATEALLFDASFEAKTGEANANIRVPLQVRVNSTSCELSLDGALPVILMSLGRSGSSITWDTMSALTGQRNVASEITGGNPETSKEFFSHLEENPYESHNWPTKRLCLIQKNHDKSKGAGIVGFQWKPYMSSFDSVYAIEGLKEVAARHIAIVYLTRNPIDRKISNLRHDQSRASSDLIAAHCVVGDEACIKKHAAFDQDLVFPVGDTLLRWMRSAVRNDHLIKKRLLDLNVKFIEITYERLYNADDADEWMRTFEFLRIGPAKNLSMDDIRATFSMASTHSKSRDQTIANYAEVKKTLAGTEFEHFLS